jgi:RNA polymerase sigma factor (TIGR02999 family)
MSEITRILDRLQHGELKASDELLPLVYDELRRLAAHKLACEDAGHTLQPTALVHEAWLRLAGDGAQSWSSQTHFVAAAAEAMRRILIDSARRKQAQRRGGRPKREELQEEHWVLERPVDEVLAVHEALDKLASQDRAAAELVKLRYFVGIPLHEIAPALGISKRTANRLWAFAKAWLKVEIIGEKLSL